MAEFWLLMALNWIPVSKNCILMQEMHNIINMVIQIIIYMQKKVLFSIFNGIIKSGLFSSVAAKILHSHINSLVIRP